MVTGLGEGKLAIETSCTLFKSWPCVACCSCKRVGEIYVYTV